MGVIQTASRQILQPVYSAGGGSGQLAAGHWVPAKMSLTSTRVVHPRPDAETSSYAYHRNAHASVQYVCPITVQGGAYPLWYEIISAPSGTTIGQFYNSADYGVVKWTPTSGTQTFTIRVHDQDGSTTDVTWTAVVGTSWLLFVDSVNGNNGNAGTFAAPYQTYAAALAAATGGKALCFRAGTYTPVAGGQNLSSSLHNTLFGYPGETATFNCAVTNTTQGLWNQLSADCMILNLTFSGTLAGTNPRHFTNTALVNRQYIWGCTFSDSGGSSGTDNSACWFCGDPGGQRQYVGMWGCTFSNLPTSANGYMIFDTYQSKYVVIEGNTLGTPGTAQQHNIFIKGAGNQEVSVRANTWTQAWTSDLNLYLGSDGSTGTPASTNQEICFNTIIGVNLNNWSNFAVMINQAQNNSSAATIWSYRNTIYGQPCIYNNTVNALTFTSDNDVVVNNATASGLVGKWLCVDFNDSATTFRNPANITGITYAINGTECQGATAANILDGSFKLQGSFRTSYLGVRGAEIA